MRRWDSLTGLVAGFYSMFGLSIVLTRSFTGWTPSHLDSYLIISFGSGTIGACGGWILADRKL